MNIDAFNESMRKKHYLFPVKKIYPWGDRYYVLLDSRNINNGKIEHIYFEAENEEHANTIINDFATTIRATKDKCVVGSLQQEHYCHLNSKPKKIEAGFYEYRGYEIMDQYDTSFLGGGGTKMGRWVAKEKPWLDGKFFSSFDTLKDAMLAIDKHLDKL
jgi:hypothetical protein